MRWCFLLLLVPCITTIDTTRLAELNNAAIDLLEAGRSHEAAAGFRAAIALAPFGPEAYYNLGIAYKDLKRHHNSVSAYLAAISLRPAFPEAHFNLGRALQMLTDDPGPHGLMHDHELRKAALLRAAHHFRRSVRPEQGAADSFRSLEEVLYQLGDADGAAAAYDAYLQRSPRDGLRRRRRVPCARLREVLRQRREAAAGGAAVPPPPRSLCTATSEPPDEAIASFAEHGCAGHHLRAPRAVTRRHPRGQVRSSAAAAGY